MPISNICSQSEIVNKEQQQLTKRTTTYDKNKLEIKCLCSINDNYFIYSTKDEINITKLDDTKKGTQYNIIKTFKYNDEEKLRFTKTERVSQMELLENDKNNELIKNDNKEQLE